MDTLQIIKELCEREGIKISALEKEMGYGNGSLAKAKKIPAERILEISKRFNVSMDYLMTGQEPVNHPTSELNQRDEKDIAKIIEQTKERLLAQEGLMFEGSPAAPEAIDSIVSAMQIGMEIAKKKNKELYTPKKYKKD